ncbi:MAG: TIGR00159 family protein [Geobacter sp.]|nr:TIGR00159 family protein [Geobacter sp.]
MRIQDIADILIMTLLVYQLYAWFRKTRALQVVLGLGFLVLLYVLTKNLGLFMTSWILQELGTVIFILIIVIFQGEIRQALYRFSLLRNFFNSNESHHKLPEIQAVVEAAFALAKRNSGALIVFERRERLDDYLLHGVKLDSLLSSQLLVNIFEDGAPLHDGAAVIRNGRISEASSHLPLSSNQELPQYLGTRHRAAVGLSEKTDALVIVVSEERGTVSVVAGGELHKVETPEQLYNLLVEELAMQGADNCRLPLRKAIFSNILPKSVTLLLVIACWLLINARQGGLQTVPAQIKFHNLPEKLVLSDNLPGEVEVQLKVLSTIFMSSKKLDVVADLDLSKIHEGLNNIPVDSKVFQLPLGVSVSKVTPPVMKIIAERKMYRELPVVLKTEGKLKRGLYLKSVKIEPARVKVVGSESALSQFTQVNTEVLNLSSLSANRTVDLPLQPLSPQLQIKRDDPVSVKLQIGGK